MGDAVATMIEWFNELNAEDHAGADVDRTDWRAWWALLDDLPPTDHARLAQWYETL